MVSRSLERPSLLTGTRGRFQLHALQQLTDLGGGRFESTGTAPRFVVQRARARAGQGIPGGWVRIRFTIADFH